MMRTSETLNNLQHRGDIMNPAIRKVKSRLFNMSKKEIDTFILANDFNEFEKKVIYLKARGTDSRCIEVILGCNRQELHKGYERIAKAL